LLVLVPLGLGGCPTGGQLSDPNDHLGEHSCDAPQLFLTSCAGSVCHSPDANGNVVGEIDLVTPGFEADLIDRPSDYSAVEDSDACPPAGAELIVNTASPEASLLIRKTSGGHACGLPMPPPGYAPLSEVDLECIRQFTLALAAQGPVGGSGGAGSGGAEASGAAAGSAGEGGGP